MANDKEFKNIAELNKYITGIATKLSKEALKTPLNSAGNRVLNIIEESFESETNPVTNQKWEDLKESTKLRKLKKGRSSKPLRDRGALADKWRVSNSGTETKVYNNSKKDGFVYGIAHHFGSDNAGRNKNTKIPSRGFLPINDDGGLTPDLEKEILEIFEEFIVKAF